MSQFNFPSDILQALEALNTLNSGSTEPPKSAPYMLWMDTSVAQAVLKQRNAEDTAWEVLLTAGNTSFDDTQAQLGVQDVQKAIEKLKESLDAVLNKPADVPVGTVSALAVSTVPSGWLECNGAEVSRTEYAALFALLGTKYGAGDGSTTFELPDLRGEFIRGWDNGRGADLDVESRTDRGDGAVGNNVGTRQGDLFKNHSHDIYTSNTEDRGYIACHYYSKFELTAWRDTGKEGGSETRPRNVALMYIIKC